MIDNHQQLLRVALLPLSAACRLGSSCCAHAGPAAPCPSAAHLRLLALRLAHLVVVGCNVQQACLGPQGLDCPLEPLKVVDGTVGLQPFQILLPPCLQVVQDLCRVVAERLPHTACTLLQDVFRHCIYVGLKRQQWAALPGVREGARRDFGLQLLQGGIQVTHGGCWTVLIVV